MGWQDAPVIEEQKKPAWDAAPVIDAEHDTSDAGDTLPVKALKTVARKIVPEAAQEGAKAVGELGLSAATGIGAQAYGGLKGLLTGHSTEEAAKIIKQAQEDYTYQPRSPVAQELGKTIAKPFTMAEEGLGKAGGTIGGAIGGEKGRIAGEEIGKAALPIAGTVLPGVRPLQSAGRFAMGAEKFAKPEVPAILKPKGKTDMKGMGAAETDAERMRRERAAGLDVPTTLTKGQATREFGQQQFEKEAMKRPKEGAPLREKLAEQVNNIYQNFDAWLEQTGGQAVDTGKVGRSVDAALVAKAQKAKAHIRSLYNQAKESGELQEAVPTSDLSKYVEDHAAEAINAPVITSVGAKLKQLAEKTGKPDSLSINELEELRKMVNQVAQPGTPNMVFGGEIKRLIDGLTEGKGGDVYKQARLARRKYAEEFENQGAVAKLLRTKPGTDDRAVAFEDVQQHIVGGSLDDLRNVRRTLQTAGDAGKQAWRDVQGMTIQSLRDLVESGVSKDEQGTTMPSLAKFNNRIKALDQDGKLDYLFGKQGAQKLRDMRDHMQDVLTAPPGAVNFSNTASAWINALDFMQSKLGVVPGVKHAVGHMKERAESAEIQKKVKSALGEEQNQRPLFTMSGKPVLDKIEGGKSEEYNPWRKKEAEK